MKGLRVMLKEATKYTNTERQRTAGGNMPADEVQNSRNGSYKSRHPMQAPTHGKEKSRLSRNV